MRVQSCHPSNKYNPWERAIYQHERYSYMVKNNKQGDRGSTEDKSKVNASKHLNMVASVTEELTEPKEVHSTPTLADIQEILQSIQNSMNKLEIDIAELKSSFKTQETKLKNTQEALKGAVESNKQLRKELHGNFRNSRGCLRERRVVLKIAQVLNVDVKAKDIHICHRVKGKNLNPIIARIVSHRVKRALYKKRVRLKNVQLSELFPSASVSARVASERIFINENPTAFRRRLVKKVTDKKND